MQSLSGALRSYEGRGRPIHIPFPQLAELVDFRTGQIAVIAGASGSGKSTLAANWCVRSHDPILYLAQEDPLSTINTMTALTMDRRKNDITPEDAGYWADRLKSKEREELVIQKGAQTLSDIEARIIALTEWLMEPPRLIVVDSLFDVRDDTAGGYMENKWYATVLPGLKELTLNYDVGLMLQHHVKRDGNKALGTEPLNMTSLMFGGEKESAHVWGVYYTEARNRQTHVQILKQRNGRADPGGGLSVTLDWHPDTGRMWSR